MKKYLAVIDTNVLVSSLISKKIDSATVVVLEKLFDGTIIPLINDEILDEYKDVLNRKKFKFPAEQIDQLLTTIFNVGIMTEKTFSTENFPDPKDTVFYEVTLSKTNEDAHLITGNIKHFPKKNFCCHTF